MNHRILGEMKIPCSQSQIASDFGVLREQDVSTEHGYIAVNSLSLIDRDAAEEDRYIPLRAAVQMN